jgi:hypothetical protein
MKPGISRRQWLRSSACGFGYLALADLCAQQNRAVADGQPAPAASGPLAPRPPHFTAKARRVIFLFMHGAPSQVDSFDYKPLLQQRSGETCPIELPRLVQTQRLGKLYGSPWRFQRHGQSGQWASELFPNLAQHVDKLCFIKSMHTEGLAHGQGVLRLHTGQAQFVRPSMGSWVVYGLGSENRNLPGFVCIDYPGLHGGVQNYSGAFLPAAYQGMNLRVADAPQRRAVIHNLGNQEMASGQQRQHLDLIQALNREHLRRAGEDDQLEGIIQSYELAFNMQMEAPRVMDLSGESPATLRLYGIGTEPSDAYGRACLLARRFAEAGVRFIQVDCGFHWDHHNRIRADMPVSAAKVDRPIAGLLTDLDRRGLLEDTLVLWAGEFGRTPVAQIDNGLERAGRDHNPEAFTIWLAGAGVKPGISYGATDDFGYFAMIDKVHMHDLHATLLHLLGLDHERLTYRHAGRDFRLTDVYGNVVHGVLT